jgi:ABC-type transport system substrate-binding protein
MPRTFKATIALIVTLVLLSLITIVNVWQADNTEEQVIELQRRVSSLKSAQDKILKKLESGVAVSGSRGSSGGARGNAGSQNKYRAALQDESNILEPRSREIIPEDAPDGGTLRRRLGSDPKGFNWLTENGADVQMISEYVHNTFAERDLDKPDKFVPELAYKVEVSDDYTEYTIHIRDDVYWQTPNVDTSKEKYAWIEDADKKLTAEDCVFTFNLLQNPQVQAGSTKNYFKDMKTAKVVDENTFKVVWNKKTHQSLSATLTMFPLPKWLYTRTEDGDDIPKESLGLKFNSHWANRHPVGTGPYTFENFEPGSKIKLERNPDFWGDKPPIEGIEFQIVKKPQTGYLRAKADKLDFTSLNPPLYKQHIEEGGSSSPFEQGKLEYKKVDRFVYYYIGWNSDKPLFSDRRVRTAMTHALNRKGIIDNVLHGLGHIQYGPYYYKHPANNPDVEPLAYDLDKSRKLLKEAGWSDEDGDGVREKKIDGKTREFKFDILAYSKPTTRAYLSVYKEDLRKIGIQMNPRQVSWPTMQKKMDERDFDAYTGGWALAWGIDPYQIWHSSQADTPKGSNRVGFRNERADEIIETLRKTFDKKKRKKLYHEFHKIVHREQPYTFFYAPKTVYAWQPRLENVVFQKIRPQALSIPWHFNATSLQK